MEGEKLDIRRWGLRSTTILAVGSLFVWTAQFAFAAPPSNDNAATATLVAGPPYATVQSTTGATMEAVEYQPSSVPQPANFSCPGKTIGATVWFKMSAVAGQSVTADTYGSTFDTLMAIWVDFSGNGSSLTLLGCNDDYLGKQSHVSFSTGAGAIYWFQVGGVNSTTGTLKFSLAKALPGDNVSEAKVIPAPTYMDATTNVGATLEAGEVRPCGNIGTTLWYTYTLPSSLIYADVIADTSGSTFNTVLAVWGASGGQLNLLGCSDGSTTGGRGRLGLGITGGTPYYFQVGGANSAQGAIKFTLSLAPIPIPPLPSPVTQPLSINPRVRGNADSSNTIYNDSNFNSTVDPAEPAVTVPGAPVNPKARTNSDDTVTVWNDGNGNDQIDNGEASATSPSPPARPKIKDSPDGSRTIYNDKNNNNTVDSGEEIITVPAPGSIGPPNIKTRTNPDGSVTIYNDKNNNNTVDSGETIAGTPSPRPSNDSQASPMSFITQPGTHATLTALATFEPNEPTSCGMGAATVWYSYTPTRDRTLILGVEAGFVPVAAVYTNGSSTLVACNGGASAEANTTFVAFQAKAGQTYLFQIGGLSSGVNSGPVIVELVGP